MRLLTRKEVDRDTKIRENRDTARLHLVNEELARKENILNQVVDNVDSDKEKVIRDFESFKQDYTQKKAKLVGDIDVLERKRSVLEIESIRERATTIALEELESAFLDKKRKVEGSIKEQNIQLSQRQKDLLGDLRKYTYQLERVDERAISQDDREKKLHDTKVELDTRNEKLDERGYILEQTAEREREVVKEDMLGVQTGRASNELVKEQLNREWKKIETTQLAFIQEKSLMQDSIRESQERDKQIVVQEEHNEKIKDNLEEEWKKMERDKVVLKENKDTFTKIEEKLQEQIAEFQAKKSAQRLEKQNIEQEKRDIKNANIKLKDERAILNSAWEELKTK